MSVLVISESDIIIGVVEDILNNSEDEIEVISVKKLELICNMQYDNIEMIIIDIRNDYLELLSFIESIKSINKGIKVIVLDIRKRGVIFKRALKNGVEGYVADIPDKHDFFSIIQSVIKGKKYYDLDLLEKLFEHEEKHSRNKLTKREDEVLQLIGDGCNNKEIGNKLYITECTVKKHVSNIFVKLNLRNRKEAISYVKLQSKE